MDEKDKILLARAQFLAAAGEGLTGVNPSVGCVLATPCGSVIVEAATAVGGRPHAEEIALRRAGDEARGAWCYVSLEPCSRRSNGSSSCAHQLIDSGISKVFIARPEQNPAAAGGSKMLAKAKIAIEWMHSPQPQSSGYNRRQSVSSSPNPFSELETG